MLRLYRWQVVFGHHLPYAGQHTQKREARRAMHRALRKLRRRVLQEKRDALGVVYRHDQVLVARTRMTPNTALNPPVRQLIVEQVHARAEPSITQREGIRPS